MPACHLRHDRARRKQFRDDPPLVRVTPPSPATNATANLDAPSRRGSVNYMVDHICEPMPSTGSHLPNYAARCKMGERHRWAKEAARHSYLSAERGRRRGDDLLGSTRLSDLRHRSAQSAGNLAPDFGISEKAAARTRTVQSFQRKRPSGLHASRSPIISRASVSSLPPDSCPYCGSAKLSKHRDAGGGPAAVEGDPNGAGKVLVPGMLEDHATAGALPRHAARLCRAEPVGHHPV